MWNILAFLLWQSRQERKRPGSKFGELIEAHIKDVAEDQCKFSHSDIMMIGWWFEIWRAFHSTWDDQDIAGLSENKAYNFIHWWIIIFPSCSHHFPHEMAASWSPFSDPSHCAQEGQLVPASIVVELLLQAWRPMANRNFLSYTSWINFGYILRGFHSHRGTPNSWKQTGLMENPVISWMLTGDALVQAMREQGWEGGKYLIDGFPRRQAQSVKTSKDFAQFELKSIQGYPSSLTPYWLLFNFLPASDFSMLRGASITWKLGGRLSVTRLRQLRQSRGSQNLSWWYMFWEWPLPATCLDSMTVYGSRFFSHLSLSNVIYFMVELSDNFPTIPLTFGFQKPTTGKNW